MSQQFRLFEDPEPEKPAGPEPGELRGDLEALHAAARRVEVWCGPRHGWRPFLGPVGGRAGRVVVGVRQGRAMASVTYDLGPYTFGHQVSGDAPSE